MNYSLCKSILTLCLLLPGLTVWSQVSATWSADNGNNTYSNPLLYGDWPDPDVIRVGDDYYFVSTSMHFVPGTPIAKSKDMINWEIVGYAVDRYDEDERYNMVGGQMYINGSWANTIRYHKGKFYVGFCTPYGKNTKDGNFSICVADNPKGPWKRTIFPEYLYDPGLLFDDDGKVYIAHGQGTIYVTELNEDALSVKTPQKKVYYNPKHPYLEGSHIYKINGIYYLLNSSSAVEEVCLRSKSIYGPYEEKTILKDKTKTPYATHPPHQGGMVQLKDGSWWFIIMQDYGPIGRTPNLLPVTWVDDWPMLGVDGKMPMTYKKPIITNSNRPTSPATTDEFNSPVLGLQWQWNHNPDTSKYSLIDREGYLRMKTGNKATELSVARNTLTQRIQGPNSTATVLMDVKNMEDGNTAGLTVFQKPYAYIAVKQTGNQRKIIMYNASKIIDSTEVIRGDLIWFRTKVSETGTADFFYSYDGEKYKSLGNTFLMQLGYPWTANRFGLFNFSTTDHGLNGYVDFNWFRFSVDFVAVNNTIKKGESVQFKVGTISDKKVKYKWIFEGGNPSKSTKPNPIIKYAKSGVYSVSLKSSTGSSTDKLTRRSYIKVE